MGRLEGKTVLMFGGAGGIGSAASLRLADEGAKVVVTSLHEAKAQEVAARITDKGGEALAIGVDIGDDDAVAAGVLAAVNEFGGIDAVHVNAADMSYETIGNDTDAATIDLGVFDRTIRTGLRGYLLCTRHVIPQLMARGGGAVVYTSSASAFIGEPERPAYAISKSGVHALVRHVASRWGKEGIRANAIAPGPILTEQALAGMPPEFLEQMHAAVRSPRLGRPEDIAACVAWLMSPDGEWINGQVISVDGGMTLR